MSVNILNKEIKKKLIPPSLPCIHFILKNLGSCSLKKNKKRTLVNILNKKIKKKQAYSSPSGLPYIHFVLKGPGSCSLKKKNQKRMIVNILNKKLKKKKRKAIHLPLAYLVSIS